MVVYVFSVHSDHSGQIFQPRLIAGPLINWESELGHQVGVWSYSSDQTLHIINSQARTAYVLTSVI